MSRVSTRRFIPVLIFILLLALLALLLVHVPAAKADEPPPGAPRLGSYKWDGWVDNNGDGVLSPGDDIKYKIGVFNYPIFTTAENVKFTDEIPEWTTANDDVTLEGPPGDGTIMPRGPQDPVTIEGMSVSWGCWSGRVIKFSVRVVCPVDCGTLVCNQGFFEYKQGDQTVICPTDDPDTTEVNDPTCIPVVSWSDLTITKAVSPVGEVKPGDQLDYSFTINNSGCMNARNVEFDDTIPANTTAVGNAIASSGAVVTQDPLKITDMTVNAHQSATVSFSVKVDKPLDCGTVISNKGSVTYDPDGANCPKPPVTVDSNTVENPVVSSAKLEISKSVTPAGNVKAGDQLDYKLTITNIGDMNGNDATIDDAIPANTTAVGNAVTSSGAVVSQSPVKVTGMSVPVGSTQTVTFSVKIDDDTIVGTEIANQGSVTYDPDGPNCPLETKTNVSNIVKNSVVGGAAITAVKSVSPVTAVAPGDGLNYTIVLTNNGDLTVAGATFEDAIPANTTAVGNATASSGTVASQDPVRVTGISIPVGGSATIKFSVTVDAGTPNLTVVTNIGAVTYDPDGPGPAQPVTKDTNRVSNTVRTPPLPAKVSTKWYLSEGYTGKNLYYPGESFDTYVLIQNSTKKAAQVQATFMREFDTPVVQNYTVASESRFTIHLNEVPGCSNKHISTRLVSTNGVDIAAERSMYFDYYGKQGSSDSIGVSSPSKTWYLPEGYTGDNNYPGETFNFYVLLENPNNVKANVALSFLREGNTPVDQNITLDPEARYTVKVDEIAGCQNSHISTRVVSNQPVIAERAEYFSYYGITGGHASIGAVEPATEWLMPEGYTGDNNYPGEQFNTYILLENPNPAATEATATYMRQGSTPVVVNYTLAPESRFTIHLDAVDGCENAQIATRIVSKAPIVAERAMYFDYYGTQEGSDSIAAIPGQHWLMPEGYTGDNNYPGEKFNSYLLLMNPNNKAVDVAVKFMAPPFNNASVVQVNNYTLAPLSRFTIHVDDIPKFANSAFSTDVTSLTAGAPVAAEHAMYSMYYGIKGGSCSIGYDP
jgi:uncharacterized repeat protein (TIGR01451 family)